MDLIKESFMEVADDVIKQQKIKLLKEAERFIPNITEEDLLQPNDYPELEYNPQFRHEEGILEGMLTLRMALIAYTE
ncbi:MAG: hypothetical protein P4L16_07725 [Chlamydiales bacterium]|nr:hypothetical protein [Chlamydiales bacterium]